MRIFAGYVLSLVPYVSCFVMPPALFTFPVSPPQGEASQWQVICSNTWLEACELF